MIFDIARGTAEMGFVALRTVYSSAAFVFAGANQGRDNTVMEELDVRVTLQIVNQLLRERRRRGTLAQQLCLAKLEHAFMDLRKVVWDNETVLRNHQDKWFNYWRSPATNEPLLRLSMRHLEHRLSLLSTVEVIEQPSVRLPMTIEIPRVKSPQGRITEVPCEALTVHKHSASFSAGDKNVLL
jgi:hypothetical protein